MTLFFLNKFKHRQLRSRIGAALRRALAGALVALITGASVSLYAPAPALAAGAIIWVDAFADSSGGTCNTATPIHCTTLRAAIIKSNGLGGGTTINLPTGTYQLTVPGTNEHAAATGSLDILDGVTIVGSGGIEDGDATQTIIEAGTTTSSGIDKVFSVNPIFDKSFATRFAALTIRYGQNTSDGYGGAFDWDAGPNGTGTLDIYNCSITGNSSNGTGGGLALTNTNGGMNAIYASVTIDKSTISNNTAAGTGGGIDLDSYVALTVTDSTISDNTANTTIGGGGIYAATPSKLTISGSTISGNSAVGATAVGGGIAINTPLSPSLVNTTISGNTSGSNGGGIALIHNGASQPTLTNVTIKDNHAQGGAGGGIYVNSAGPYNGTVLLKNTIVAGNFNSGSTASDIGGTNGTPVAVGSSANNLIGTGGAGGLTGTNSNQVNVSSPGLGSLANNGGLTQTHALLAGSPAIDAGNDTYATTTYDQRGTGYPRKSGAHADIGAFEFPATPDLTLTKAHTGNFTQGQTGATYTLTVSNGGTGPTSGTVSVTDSLPSGLTATAISGTGWSCAVGTMTCSRTDALAIASSYPTITLAVNVAANAAASVTNTATVSGGGEVNTANDSASDTTTVNPLFATTLVVSAIAPVTYPANPVITATLTENAGNTGLNGKTITIVINSQTYSPTTNPSGVVTVTYSGLALNAGSYPVTATFAGDATYKASSDNSKSALVNRHTTNMTLAPPSQTITYGQSGAVTATLTDGATPLASQTITFSDGSTTICTGTTDAAGQAACTPNEPAGTFTITATYAATTNYLGSTATASLTVNKAASTLTTADKTITYGSPVTLTATLTDGVAGINGRTINFKVNNVVVGPGTTNASGVATFTYTPTLASGTYPIDASFAGDTFYLASNATQMTLTVNKAATTLTAVDQTFGYGSAVTLTATLTDGVAGINGQTVQFTVNGTVVGTGTTNATGVATYTYTPTLVVGTYTIDASFAGDTFYLLSTAVQKTLTVTKGATTLVTANQTITYGQPVTLTATLTQTDGSVPLNGRPITFNVNNVTVGTGTTNPSGVATYTYTPTLASGTYAIDATFAGDAFYQVSNATSKTLTVNKVVSTLTTVDQAVTYGSPVTLTATLTDGVAGINGKTINFKVNSVAVGTGTTNASGVATYTYSPILASGTYPIDASFASDTFYLASAATSKTLTVNKAATTLTAADQTVAYGSTVTLTATLTDGAAGINGRTIDFKVNSVTVGSGTTNASGVATHTYTPTLAVGTYTIAASFASDTFYLSSTNNSQSLVVTPAVTSMTLSPATQTVNLGDTVTLTATLTPNVAGKSILFEQGATLLCTVVTDGVGQAVCNPVGLIGTGLSVTARFAGDINYSPSSASATVTVRVPDLTITKSHTGNFTQGETGKTYTLTATNIGPGSTLGTTTVTDTLPAGLTATTISGSGWTCDSPTLTCTRSDVLAAGASYPVITVTVNVGVTAAPSLTNTAHVSGGGEINTTNNTVTDVTTITQLPDLTITKTHNGSFVRGQSGFTYTLTVTNSGLAASGTTTVTVTDTLPAGLTAIAIGGTGWTCTLNPLTCTRLSGLAAGAHYEPITVTVYVASNALNTVTNQAVVSGGGEVNLANDTVSDPTNVVDAPPPLYVTISAPVTLTRDATITVTGTANTFAWVQVNSASVQASGNGTWSAVVTLQEGPNVITATNGSAKQSITVTRDTTPPVITLTASSVKTEAETVTLTATSEAGAKIQIEGQSVTSLNVHLKMGANTFTATATDPAGNQASATVKVIRVGHEPPPPTEIAPVMDDLPDLVSKPELKVTGDGTAGAPVTLVVNGTVQATGTVAASGHFTLTATLSLGENRIHVNGTGPLVSREAVVYFEPRDIRHHWAEETILAMMRLGIVKGYDDETFRPDAPVSRLEFAIMVARLLHLDGVDAHSTFTDADLIPTWATSQIAAAVQAGLILGRGDGSFDPNARITRAEVSVILVRVLRHEGLDTTPGNASFVDGDQIPVWALQYVLTAARYGLVAGYTDGTFRPGKTATRAESVTMLYRLYSLPSH